MINFSNVSYYKYVFITDYSTKYDEPYPTDLFRLNHMIFKPKADRACEQLLTHYEYGSYFLSIL